MAQTLAQSALLSENDLQRGVIETFVQESTILDRLPLLGIEGNAYAYNSEATLPGTEFRAVNSAYTESTGTVAQSTVGLVILGGDADVDRFIVQTRGNLNDQRAIQTRLKVKSAVYKFQDTFFNGSTGTDANSFNGLKTSLSGGQVISMGTNGAAIQTDDSTRHAFFDKLDELIAAATFNGRGPDALYMNDLIKGKFVSAARRMTIATTTQDNFGKQVMTYNGIPILDPGYTAAGARILPQTETQGSSSVASSVYAVRFGEDESDGATTGVTNGGIQVRDLGEVDDKPVYRTRIEFYCGMALFGTKAAARLQGVLNS